jgi:hypothetical protein
MDARSHHGAEQWTQTKPAESDNSGNGNHRLHCREGQVGRADIMGRAYCAKREQHRHDGQILKQENGKAGAPRGRVEAFLVGQHLDDHGGRRHCKRQTDHGTDYPVVAQQSCAQGEAGAAQAELQKT